MLVLAVETSGPTGSLALGRFTGAQLSEAWEISWEKKAIHSEMATVQLGQLFKNAGLGLNDLSHIVVNAGPGSFTGIRVGLNLARTLAYSLSLPVAGLSSLNLLAGMAGQPDDRVFVAVKAIQNFYYAATVMITPKGLVTVVPAASVDAAELEGRSQGMTKVLVEGLTPGFSPRLNARACLETLDRWPGSVTFLTWKEIHPVYIRASEAEEKLLKGLKKREF